MVQIIPPGTRNPSFVERLSQGVGRGLEMGNQLMGKHQEKQAIQEQSQKLSQLTGMDLSGVNPETQKAIVQLALQAKQRESEQGNKFKYDSDLQKEKYGFEEQLQQNKPASASDLKAKKEEQENFNALQGAQDTLNRMKSLRKKNNLGRGSAAVGFFGGETAKDRGEYEQLGKSLIQHATNIPIRNRIEFETLAKKLYDPSIPDKEAEGILNAMERIINNSIKSYSGGESSSQEGKKPLSAFVGKK